MTVIMIIIVTITIIMIIIKVVIIIIDVLIFHLGLASVSSLEINIIMAEEYVTQER